MTEINWIHIDTAIRKSHDFVIAAHRYTREGGKGLHNDRFVRVAAINLKNYLDTIIGK